MNDTSDSNIIRKIIAEDLKTDKHQGKVATRFPPEPNGHLHIGHAKSICLNFGIAAEHKDATCNLRFDDTNPSREEAEYVEAIKEDVKWLGFDWEDRLFYASDYFEQFYDFAVQLIKKGKAYVDSLSPEAIKEYRGDFNTPGKNSPYRDRPVEENLDLFERMKAGEFEDGAHLLRAKIDMTSPNMNMRDPALYRIKHASHHRTGDTWCLYPMYDYAHCLEDAIEGITHSLCTLEFEDHRPVYDWVLDELETPCHPQQIEFARLNLSHTVMSKRKLLQLIEQNHVNGWDDPRMPTISGLRRCGYTPSAIRTFCDRIGVAKRDSIVDVAQLEHTIRDDLNETAPRVMTVLNPLKVIIDNFDDDQVEEFDAPYHPEKPDMGTRKVVLSKVLYIEKEDFREDPPKKWFRLAPGREIRLRYACLITCVNVVKDPETGAILELHCTWDPNSRGGTSPDGRKVRGTSHWVCAKNSVPCEVRLYDRLFTVTNPLNTKDGSDFTDYLNPESLSILTNCRAESSLQNAAPGSRYQFERLGYFCVDSVDSSKQKLVFNRTVSLRDSWSKIEKAQNKSTPKKPPKPAAPNSGITAISVNKALKQIKDEITIDDFSKLDLRVAVIREASLVEGANKLLKLMVDLGEDRLRQVFAGIRSSYQEPEELVGTKVIVVANMKPRTMTFGVSEAMVLAGGSKRRLTIASFDGDLLPGDKVS
ncbi:MAG: glutamine--tRNA ligase/YqeY domain fusion protein [Proteobacteria bacterium]|nr:glutamine--tRNA ligase/YqeY domain fusion protein [Pseudomonadota bacterium]